MELTGDSMELKPINTRKLRRRGNEPSETRSYPGKTQPNYPYFSVCRCNIVTLICECLMLTIFLRTFAKSSYINDFLR